MKSHPYNPIDWKHLIPNIEEIVAEMDSQPILSVGLAPYVRIIPAFFLKNFSIFSVKRSSDADILEEYFHLYVLEDWDKSFSDKVHGTNYLVKHFLFQKFYNSLKPKPRLMFNTITDDLIGTLESLHIPFFGNGPQVANQTKYKGEFRALLKKYNLSHPYAENYNFEAFQNISYADLKEKFDGSFVIQRGDKEVGGNQGTFFIYNENDFNECIHAFNLKQDFNEILVTQFVEGDSVSMLGCVTHKGILSGPLQLQFIDVPESLQGIQASGIFFGNDQGYRSWDDAIEMKAQKIVEGIGDHLKQIGYKGIFGIDFIYDKKKNNIFAIECNPRSPGSLLLYSLSLLEAKIPPLDFFHLASHLNMDFDFDFEKINSALKLHADYAHISFSPKEISSMQIPIIAGVYSYDKEKDTLIYKSAGVSLADLRDKNDFLIIDTVPKVGQQIERGVPRLFKFIFPYSIAKSSHEIEERAAFLVDRFAKTIIQADKK